MNTGLISVRYAKALFEYAKAENMLEQVYQEVKLMVTLFFEMPKLNQVLENPFFDKKEKRKLLFNAAGGNPSPALVKFVDMVLENDRETSFQGIVNKFMEFYRKEKNIHFGKITTAVPISEEVEGKIKTLLSDKGKVEFEKVVDKDILGGFVLEIDGNRLNASLAHQLEQIKSTYKNINKGAI